ncbi:transporter substrate-binding domain-containing protein [Curvibacter sp. APW13]|uniref:substrate-binding periplasmic protein n=1 Tax=Curvibacter sp. APW13 TaxID=3077236 RepID=UPI0028DD9C8E|nr:transporter substrate-binding domain-containing protein [Curvibacter sp. APW13]MDT8990631.1 transporter substrate-binding domain-containing protein [Curvibacter sp. APW13]
MHIRNLWLGVVLAGLCSVESLWAQSLRMQFAVSEWPPAEYTVDGEPHGYHIDTVGAALREMGGTAEFHFYPWKRAEMLVQRKQMAGLLSLHPTPERERQLLFSTEPLSSSDNVLFVAKGREFPVDRIEALAGKTIGTTAGYNYGADFMRLSGQGLFRTDEANTDEQGMRKLVAGRFDAFVCDRVIGLGLLRSLGLRDQVTVLPWVVSSVKLHAAFAKTPENAAFIPKFDSALRKLKKSGQWQQIMDSYLK